MIRISIELDKIPESAKWTTKDGKKMVTAIVAMRKEVDQYGYTHSVYLNQSEEEREKGEPRIYVGKGREFKFNNDR